MGSYLNFGATQPNQGTGSEPIVSTPLIRQSSVYSLTFDEFQNTMGGSGKDFGSMNMDELLKNIWTAEETQAMAMSSKLLNQGTSYNNIPSGNLQRQGSLTLPRTLSQKTVDEVWREMFSENNGVKEVNNPSLGLNLQPRQRQPTLGEVTLEEFLFKAGVVREDGPQIAMPNNNGFYIGFQQSAQNNIGMNNNNNNNINNNINNSILNSNNMSGIRPSQQPPQQPLFPKESTVTFTSSIASPGTRGPLVGIADSNMNRGLFKGGPLGRGGLASGAVKGSPANQLSPDVVAGSSGDVSSVSPPPYMLTSGASKRKSGTLEKAMERRHRRMIKNRESAARSRARKQAYTLELEAEVAKLKEMNEELRKKQEEFMETQKNKVSDTNKRRCLRRTLTGPW